MKIFFIVAAGLFILFPVVSQTSSDAKGDKTELSARQQNMFKPQPFSLNLTILEATMSGRDLARAGLSQFDKDVVREIPVIPVFLPSITAEYNIVKPVQNTKLVFNAKALATITVMQAGTAGFVSLMLPPWISLTAGVHIATAWNYGTMFTFLSVYDPSEQDYDSCTSCTEFEYGAKAEIKFTIPYGMYLFQAGYSSEYIGFTGAENGEVWTCGMNSNCVNGFRYNASFLAGRRLNNLLFKMIGLNASVSGWYSDSYFDDVYKQYDPDFVTVSFSPMIQMQLRKNQSLIIMAVVDRERNFEDNDCGTSTLLQNCTGGGMEI
jgi:hypothetical protein